MHCYLVVLNGTFDMDHIYILLSHVSAFSLVALQNDVALQVVLRMAHNSAEIEESVKSKIDEYAGRGFRALGLAVSEGGSGQAKYALSTFQNVSELQGKCPVVQPILSAGHLEEQLSSSAMLAEL